MSLKPLEIAKEFMEIKEFFDRVGFEIIGAKTDSDNTIYFIKRKKIEK
jgi:hypothetical protein